jgi:hypothetical protein
MTVHSYCCIGIFVLSGLLQIQKRIQNLLKNGFEKLKKKKKRVPLLSWLLARQPSRLLLPASFAGFSALSLPWPSSTPRGRPLLLSPLRIMGQA